MATVEFVEDGIVEECGSSVLLQDLVDGCGADIVFGCREGGCTTCIVEVLSGAENLSAPSEEELSTLEEDELNDGLRLACQVQITGDGAVKLRAGGW